MSMVIFPAWLRAVSQKRTNHNARIRSRITKYALIYFLYASIPSSMEWEKESWNLGLYKHVQLYMYTADLEGKLKDAE